VKTVYLIRHGSAARPSGDRFTGREDYPLSDEGREQARRVARALSTADIQHVVTSPLLRARQTADEIAASSGVAVSVDDDLTDMDCGEWTGLTLDEVKARWPDAWDVWTATPADAVAAGGEGVGAVAARARRVASRLADAPHDRIAVVSHRAVLKLFVLDALGAGPAGFWRIRLDTATVTEMRLGGEAQVVRLNCGLDCDVE
jgi:broad specificity phosphatase PhoE